MKLRTILLGCGLAAAAVSSAAGLNWAPNYQAALGTAAKSHKLVMLDFTATWCANCHKLDRTTYVDPNVVKAMANVVAVHVDYDHEKAIVKRYKVPEAIPVIIFVDAKGKELGRISSYVDAKQFLSIATPILKKAKK